MSRPKGYAGYGITHLGAFTLLYAAAAGLTWVAAAAVSAAILVRLCLSAAVHAWVIRKTSWLKWLVLLPIKDVLGFVIWAWSFANNTVIWNGASYRISSEGRMREKA